MSIRSRITLLATVAALAVLLVAGFGIVQVHERLLIEALDERLGTAATTYAADVDGGVLTALQAPADDDSVAQLVRDGRVVAAAPRSAAADLPQPIADAPPPGTDRVTREVAHVRPGEGPYRVLSSTLRDGDVLHLAANLDDLRGSTNALKRTLAVVIPIVVLALGALIWWFVGRALRPVESIRAQVAAIGASDLHQRVPVPAADDEVGRLARTMNGMLDRLELGATRQRRFVADASHELRSPLARMRAELEVDVAHPEGADLRATHRSMLDELAGLQHLVDDLLDVARQEEVGTTLTRREPVDLDVLVERVARRVRASERVRLDTSAVSAAQVIGDPDALGRLVTNLVDNAVRHATSTVEVALQPVGAATAELVVSDDGAGIPIEDRERVFEPFTRLDEARVVGAGGTGLGLTIVRDVAVAHGGSAVIGDRPGGGARIVVTLPILP